MDPSIPGSIIETFVDISKHEKLRFFKIVEEFDKEKKLNDFFIWVFLLLQKS